VRCSVVGRRLEAARRSMAAATAATAAVSEPAQRPAAVDTGDVMQ